MKYLLYSVLLLLIAIACNGPKNAVTTTSTKYHREIPYPKSDLIDSLEWTFRTLPVSRNRIGYALVDLGH
jgi:hypothetical protein